MEALSSIARNRVQCRELIGQNALTVGSMMITDGRGGETKNGTLVLFSIHAIIPFRHEFL